MFFYSDPTPIFKEFNEGSILITDHHYAKNVKHYAKKYGKYNVQFMVFKNNKIGLECLKWWRDNCIEWCYAKQSKGRFGDQKYLDDWTTRFNGVHVLKHLGGGLAPWNISDYEISKVNDKIYVNGKLLIFYHFHSLKIIDNMSFDLVGGYNLKMDDISNIYLPYVKTINQMIDLTQGINPNFNYGYHQNCLLDYVKLIVRIIKKYHFVVNLEN